MAILIGAACCEEEKEVCDEGVPAKLFYLPNCATINGMITLEGSHKVFVFQHQIDEEFQKSEIDVCVAYEVEKEPKILTADCTQAEVIIITSLQMR